VSDTVELGLLGENVKKLQEDIRALKLAVDLQGRTLPAQLQAGLQEAAQVIGEHLAVQDRRIDNLTNVLAEHITDTGKRFDRIDQALARIEAKLP
jgi:predicted NBD/HSP70 family sugar kinase